MDENLNLFNLLQFIYLIKIIQSNFRISYSVAKI